MKRRSPNCRWSSKLALLLLLLSFSLASLVLMQLHYNLVSSLAAPAHVQNPKIAFLFIARNRLPLDAVWDRFFQGDKEGRFSIFVHSRPGFVFNEVTTRSTYFYGRQVNNSIQVDWGESSMIQAERILLRSALKDSFNTRFVFLSDSCIPLYNFNYTYDYIMSTPTSFLDSFVDSKEGRYNPKMRSVIPAYNWRKGSQWAVLIRKHAEVVVKDVTVFPEFQKYCRRKSLPEFWRDRPVPADAYKEHNCIPDEHYVQTLLAQQGLEGEITRRTVTHTSWDLSSTKDRERRGWHPMTYKLSDATPLLIKNLKDPRPSRTVGAGFRQGNLYHLDNLHVPSVATHVSPTPAYVFSSSPVELWHRCVGHLSSPRLQLLTQSMFWIMSLLGIDNVYYQSEYRREWCSSKGKPSPCFLFARKFTRAAALKLLNTSVLVVN